MKKGLSILLGITLCLLVGFLSRLFQITSMDVWYPTLEKSVLTPPDLVFTIMWGLLYVLMGISVGILYRVHNHHRKGLVRLFGFQLLFNLLWNFFFFYMRSPAFGFANVLILDIMAITYFAGVMRVKRSSAFLFLPYMIWMFFATYLNFYILVNN